jgi:hypothetical protein
MLFPPPPPWPSCGGRVQRGQCADWNTAGAPPSRYTARHIADSAAHRGSRLGSAWRTRRRSGRVGRPRRPQSGKGIGESPAEEDKWWARAQNSVLLRLVFFVFLGSVYYGQIVMVLKCTLWIWTKDLSHFKRCMIMLVDLPTLALWHANNVFLILWLTERLDRIVRRA